MPCIMCGGEPMYLGELGSHTFLRCRDCGLEWGIRTPKCFVPTEEAIEEAKNAF
jgi:hypothetical protein